MEKLIAFIRANPTATDQEIIDANVAVIDLVPNTFLRFRTLADILDPIQAAIIEKRMGLAIEALKNGNEAAQVKADMLTQAMSWMRGQRADDGIDVGRPTVRALIDEFVPQILTLEQAAAIKRFGEKAPAYPFGREIDEADIATAKQLILEQDARAAKEAECTEDLEWLRAGFNAAEAKIFAYRTGQVELRPTKAELRSSFAG